MAKGKPKKGKYWYKIYVGECPLCGKDQGSKERVYEIDTPRPLDIQERYVYLSVTQTYDHCMGF